MEPKLTPSHVSTLRVPRALALGAVLALGLTACATGPSAPENTVTPQPSTSATIAPEDDDVPQTDAGESIAEETFSGLPDSLEGLDPDAMMDGGTIVTWVDQPTTFAVVTWGSSSCVPVITEAWSPELGAINLTVEPATAEVCTADFAPATHVIRTPDGAGEAPLDVTIEFTGDNPSTETFTLE
ncbi:hypothetical protein [Humidisolicoccus flavus]|uniref:hypothetical protein n=1 Tax=Humidisolicoccus flavus TaxID=3111414 RepID=UPI00324DBD6B